MKSPEHAKQPSKKKASTRRKGEREAMMFIELIEPTIQRLKEAHKPTWHGTDVCPVCGDEMFVRIYPSPFSADGQIELACAKGEKCLYLHAV